MITVATIREQSDGERGDGHTEGQVAEPIGQRRPAGDAAAPFAHRIGSGAGWSGPAAGRMGIGG